MGHSPFLLQVIDELGKRVRAEIKIQEIHPEYGGCINDSYQLVTNAGKFFLKRNDAAAYPNMLNSEAEGLKLLKKCTDLHVPEVLTFGKHDTQSYIVLEYFEKGTMRKDFWEEFGRALAKIHHHTQSSYGLEFDNYIGALPQRNSPHATWHEFFINERLIPQVRAAAEGAKLKDTTIKKFDTLYTKLPALVPADKPALLHGDLWSGNFMVHSSGSPAIFDPAIYFGHRETDIAMTHLFGGFHNTMWKAYDEQYPLLQGWEQRMDIHNLYPLLVHVNLFGSSYTRQVETILNTYC